MKSPFKAICHWAMLALLTGGSTIALAGGAYEYHALGDSYSSGSGTYLRDLDFSCYRSSHAYPSVVGDSIAKATFTFSACQGDVSTDLIENQTAGLNRKTDLVTFSIGGNDVGFVELILNCANYFDEYLCMNAADSIEHRIRYELPERLRDTYASVVAKAPNAQVIQIGYPRLFGEDVSCFAASGINGDEALRLNQLSDLLDEVIFTEAQKAGITYISTINAFIGHDVCSSQPYVNGKNGVFIEDVFHPTADGHRHGIAPLILDHVL